MLPVSRQQELEIKKGRRIELRCGRAATSNFRAIRARDSRKLLESTPRWQIHRMKSAVRMVGTYRPGKYSSTDMLRPAESELRGRSDIESGQKKCLVLPPVPKWPTQRDSSISE